MSSVNIKPVTQFLSALDRRQTGASPEWWTKSAKHWLEVCQKSSFAEHKMLVKAGELGGSQDTPFEQAFANLAHAYLRDKAPKLLEYEVGFQLIEKNQENTKAVGVFGFKVADQWLYAPVFFLNGDLKGHELLYLKSQDLFVPMKDNWIDYLLGRKPAMLGKSINKQLTDIGHLAPDLARLTRSPQKWASVMPRMSSWFQEFLPTFARLATEKTAEAEVPFLAALRDSGRAGFVFLQKVAEHYPQVYRAVEERYGVDNLKQVARRVGEDEAMAKQGGSLLKKAKKGDKSDGVKGTVFDRGTVMNRLNDTDKKETGGHADVILRTDYFNGNAQDVQLTDDERRTLLDEGKVVKDDRPPSAVSKVYNGSTSLKLFNPDETNVYEVLVRPGGFEKCLVIMHPVGHHTHSGCCVISIDGEKRWENAHPSRIYCRSRFSREAWNVWFDKLEDVKSLPMEGEHSWSRDKIVILGRDGQGTYPVSAREEYEDDHGKSYSASFEAYCGSDLSKPEFSTWKNTGWKDTDHMDVTPNIRDVDYVRFVDRAGNTMKIIGEELQIPWGFKKLTVEKVDKDYTLTKEKQPASKKRPLSFGKLVDVQLALLNNTTPMEILDDKTQVTINDQKYNKEAAFKALVLQWGLRAEMADELLKRAADNPRTKQKFLVKLASPFLSDSGPSAPGFPSYNTHNDSMMGSSVPTQELDERNVRVQDMVPDPSNRVKYKPMGPDPDTMNMAGQAAQSGQKDVFDTAMLGSLLKTVRQDNMVDKYIGDLMKGMDRKGRIYFQFLWHGEEFEDRYGKQDLPEIEDGLRNAFEADGDIILSLKRKSVEPFADQGNDVDLGAIANQ